MLWTACPSSRVSPRAVRALNHSVLQACYHMQSWSSGHSMAFILPCELNDFIAPWMVAGSLSMSCGPAAVVHNGLERRICPCHKFSWQRLQLLTSSRRTQLLADVCGVNTVSWWPTCKTTHGTIGTSKKKQLSVSLLVLSFPLFYACRRCYYHWGKAKKSSTAKKW